MFWEPKPIRELVKGPFELAVSPDGSWVAYSGDAGAQWRLVEPVTGFSCRHLVLPGPLSTLWSRAPTPAVMAVEVLSFEAREKGPLGLKHQFAGDWPNHPLVSEGAMAADFGKAHVGDPAIAAAALQAFIELSPTRADGLGASLAQIVTAAARADPSVRRQLEALFDDYSIDHVSAVMRTAGVLEALGETTTEQKLARWASIVSSDRAAVERAFHEQGGIDQALAGLMWRLAKTSFAQGSVDELVRQAAKDWLTVLERRLRPRKLAAYETDVEPWSESYSEQLMASYAAMVLGLAGEREFLLTLPRKKQVTRAPWPPTFARGSSFDARVKEGAGPEFVSVSSWLSVATDPAAR
jgi:hypothetical protein